MAPNGLAIVRELQEREPSRKELKKLLSFLSSETAHKADELYQIWEKPEYLPMVSLPHLKNAAKSSPRANPQEIRFYAKGTARGSYFSKCDPHQLNENSCWALDEKMPTSSKPA